MNSEVKAYRLNDPMTWKEFKSMPDDLQIAYIKSIRQRYNVSDRKIAIELFGVDQKNVAKAVGRLGIGVGRHNYKQGTADIEGWEKWLNGISEKETNPVAVSESEESEVEYIPEETEVVDVVKDVSFVSDDEDDVEQDISVEKPATSSEAPKSGMLMFESNAKEALETIGMILKDANVRLTITWDVAGA